MRHRWSRDIDAPASNGARGTGISGGDRVSTKWSGRRDLNPRPLRPERSALPTCATARQTVLEPTTLQQIALNSPIWQIRLTDFGRPVVLIFVAFYNRIFVDN